MKKFKQLREQFLSEALSRKFNDKDVDKEFKSMKDAGAFYGDLDKAREEMKKDYHPGNSARPNVWTALRYPVRNGDYYFAFIDKSEKKNMKYNQMLNDALKTAKVGGDKKSVDDLWLVASNELRTYPTSLGWNDTMTREEIYGAIQHMLGKIREEVQQTKEFFGMFNKKDPHKHLRVGKRKNAPRYESVKESYIEEASFSSSLIKRAVKIAKDMGGNMTGAYKKIERMKKGLGDHPDVENALRLANESVSEGTMAIGIKDRDPKERAKAQAQLSSMLKKDGNKKVGSKEGKKFDEVLDTYILSDDLLADEFANPKNKNMKIIDLLNKHAKRLRVDFSESLEEGFMKKMSQIQIKRKYGRVIKRALSKGSLELPSDAEEALYMYAFDNGEIKTDDPDEFTDWLDDNLKDFS